MGFREVVSCCRSAGRQVGLLAQPKTGKTLSHKFEHFHTIPLSHVDKCSCANTARKIVTILSCDGGGTRGFIPMLIANKIADQTGLEPSEAFQVLGGTSVGGIMACICNVKSKEDPEQPAYKIK